MKILAGTAGNSDKLDVTVANLYDLDPVTKEYTVLGDDYVLQSFLTDDGTTVSCSGVVKEIAYTVVIKNDVFVQTNGDVNILKVVNVLADVVV